MLLDLIFFIMRTLFSIATLAIMITVIFFFLEYSCVIVLCYFLLYSKVNQPCVYTELLLLGFPSHLGSPESTEEISQCCTVKFSSIIYFVSHLLLGTIQGKGFWEAELLAWLSFQQNISAQTRRNKDSLVKVSEVRGMLVP